MVVHPSMMDKRTREYKDWSEQQKAEKKAKKEARQEAQGLAQGALPVAEAPASLLPPEPPVDREPVNPGTKTDEVVAEVGPKEKPTTGKKSPTRPWERMNERRPWRRDYFALQRKRPGFRCRFVDPNNVNVRLEKGYQVADPNDYGGLVDVDIRDSAGLGKVLMRHGMVLMEIPEEGARAYERQQQELIASRKRSTKAELDKEAASVGVEVREK